MRHSTKEEGGQLSVRVGLASTETNCDPSDAVRRNAMGVVETGGDIAWVSEPAWTPPSASVPAADLFWRD